MNASEPKMFAREFLVGAVTAIIALALFVDIASDWKVIAIGALLVEGFLIIAVMLGWSRKIEWRIDAWRTRHKIDKHPDLVDEFYRLLSRVSRVLYERRNDQVSLVLQGDQAIERLPSGEHSLLGEFRDKIAMLQSAYQAMVAPILPHARSRHHWRTLELVEAIRLVENHLCLLDRVFQTASRQAWLWIDAHRDQPFPTESWDVWEAFREEYNTVLDGWKTFMERFSKIIGYVGESQARRAGPLPTRRTTETTA